MSAMATESRAVADSAGIAQAAAPEPAEHGQYLTFTLGEELFALGILAVKEIIEYGHLTPVPMMPAWIRGVINLRGAVVPVVDLSARFGRGRMELTRRTCIVIVELERRGERHVLGVMVDAVSEVLDIAPAQIEPPPAFGGGVRTGFIEGMGKVNGSFVVILDADQVLWSDELDVLESASL